MIFFVKRKYDILKRKKRRLIFLGSPFIYYQLLLLVFHNKFIFSLFPNLFRVYLHYYKIRFQFIRTSKIVKHRFQIGIIAFFKQFCQVVCRLESVFKLAQNRCNMIAAQFSCYIIKAIDITTQSIYCRYYILIRIFIFDFSFQLFNFLIIFCHSIFQIASTRNRDKKHKRKN